MNEYLSQVNSGWFYLIVAVVLTYVTVMCVVFLVKSYRAGIKIGMEKEVLKKCSELWAFCDNGEPSEGMCEEIEMAKKLGIPVRYFRKEKPCMDVIA